MKKSELRQLIKEEITKILKETPINPKSILSKSDLQQISNVIMDIYSNWMDFEDEANEKGEVWDTEDDEWVSLEDIIIKSIIYSELDFDNKLDKYPGGIDLHDYIEKYHPEFIKKIANQIKKDNPSYFNVEDNNTPQIIPPKINKPPIQTPQEIIKQYIKNGSKGNLDLSFTQISKLPQGLKVGGNLNLYNTEITQLPQDLQVGGDLDLDYTPITKMPQGLKVGGDLDLEFTPISRKYTKEQIRKMAPGVKGDIYI
jgi:hypothetical protein